MEVLEQAAELQAVAVVGGVDDLFDEGGGEDVVLVEGDVLDIGGLTIETASTASASAATST